MLAFGVSIYLTVRLTPELVWLLWLSCENFPKSVEQLVRRAENKRAICKPANSVLETWLDMEGGGSSGFDEELTSYGGEPGSRMCASCVQ